MYLPPGNLLQMTVSEPVIHGAHPEFSILPMQRVEHARALMALFNLSFLNLDFANAARRACRSIDGVLHSVNSCGATIP